MNQLDRNEIFVIKACKGHFNGNVGGDEARLIIQRLIYGNPRPYFLCELRTVTELLLKTRNWTVEQWNDFVNDSILKAREMPNFFQSGKTLVDDVRELERNLISIYLSKIADLRVFEGDKCLIDLEITAEEEEKVMEALDNKE